MAEPRDVQELVKRLMAGHSPEENQALLEALLSGQVSSIFEKLQADQEPTLHPVPAEVRGYRVRLDLRGGEAAGVEAARTARRPHAAPAA